jgi:hypothetical protein
MGSLLTPYSSVEEVKGHGACNIDPAGPGRGLVV